MWNLRRSFSVCCPRCFFVDTVSSVSDETAIAAFAEMGYIETEVGAFCPECAPLLYGRGAASSDFAVGDPVVRWDDGFFAGHVLRSSNEGWTEVRSTGGYPVVYASRELRALP
jgi:hypothetical protein